MRGVAAACLFAGIAAGTWAATGIPVETASLRARTAAATLITRLQSRLMEELRAGGPARGIEVCSAEAQAIAEGLAVAGLSVRRVSRKPRNAVNAPDPFETAILESMERRHDVGEEVGDHQEVVPTADGEELRLLRPIRVAKPCLACHGARDGLAPEVRDVLAARYPDDRAVGYREGDFRGAVSVRVRLDAPRSESDDSTP